MSAERRIQAGKSDGAVDLQRGCPKCAAAPFERFLPGLIARSNLWPWHWGRPRWAIICRACKEIVDYVYERPEFEWWNGVRDLAPLDEGKGTGDANSTRFRG